MARHQLANRSAEARWQQLDLTHNNDWVEIVRFAYKENVPPHITDFITLDLGDDSINIDIAHLIEHEGYSARAVKKYVDSILQKSFDDIEDINYVVDVQKIKKYIEPKIIAVLDKLIK